MAREKVAGSIPACGSATPTANAGKVAVAFIEGKSWRASTARRTDERPGKAKVSRWSD